MDFSVFDFSYDGVIIIDKSHLVVYCNNAAALICDSSIRRLMPTNVDRRKKLVEVISLSESNLFIFEGGKLGLDAPCPWTELNYKIPEKNKAGKAQVSVQPFQFKGQPYWIFTLHDVTLEETLHRKYQGELEQKEGVILELKKAQSQLESYSKNLEKMVEERTLELSSVNGTLNAIMDSLGQGFLVFDTHGICSKIFTKACVEILETEPSQKKIWDVLKLGGKAQEEFKMWLKASYSESLPFESLKDLAPQVFSHSGGRHITLDYFPIRDEYGKFTNMVLVATDKTLEYRANIALEKERKYAEMIIKLITNKDQFCKFIESAKSSIKLAQTLANSEPVDRDQIFRILHTLEGEAGAFSIESLRQSCRASQKYLQELGSPDQNTQLRFSLEDLELVYFTFLEDNSSLFSAVRIGLERGFEFSVSHLNKFLAFLKSSPSPPSILEEYEYNFIRIPLESSMGHFNRLVCEIAPQLGKKVYPVIFDCDEVRVNPLTVDALFSTLVHAFRNAVDHGIEAPEEREMMQKDPVGSITVRGRYLNGRTWAQIEIEDDGGGIDLESLAKKAVEKIPDLNLSGMSEAEILQLVFHPGLSSREAIGEFSGRGVGMDAIAHEVQLLGGHVWMESNLGLGSKLCLKVPVCEIHQLIAKSA